MKSLKNPETGEKKSDGIKREPVSGWMHSIGIPLSIAGLAVLEVLAVRNGNIWQTISFAVFGVCLVLVYTFSTLYHLLPLKPFAKQIFQHLDRTMIYLLIAGSYTPVCLLVIRNTWGWSVLAIIWGLALFGIISRWFIPRAPGYAHSAMYVVMGWLAIFIIKLLYQSLPFYGLILLFGGGIAYTLGVVFFVLERWYPRKKHFGMHEIFHIFVLAGSASHYVLMLVIATKLYIK